MSRLNTQSNRAKDKSSCLAVLDQVLNEQAIAWTPQEAEAIVRLVLLDLEPTGSGTDSRANEGFTDQFGMCLELLKCRARMQLRSKGSGKVSSPAAPPR